MSRERVLTDKQLARIEPLMPSSDGQKSRPLRDHRQVVEGIIYRLRTGIAWRDLPASFGPWQTVWKRHHRFSIDGTRDRIHTRLLVPRSTVLISTRPRRAGSRSLPVAGPSAHRGLSRTTRICGPVCAKSHLTMRWAAPAEGWSTKIHQLVDGRGRPLVIAVTPSQAGDSPMLQPLLAHKQWRGLATRYDKLAAVYRRGVVLRAITIWLTT